VGTFVGANGLVGIFVALVGDFVGPRVVGNVGANGAVSVGTVVGLLVGAFVEYCVRKCRWFQDDVELSSIVLFVDNNRL
jgi:hypothetical protein